MDAGILWRVLMPSGAMSLLNVAVVRSIDVFDNSHDFKVVWVYATSMFARAGRAGFPVMARVVHDHSVWDWPYVAFVGPPVGQCRLPVPRMKHPIPGTD